MKKKCIAIITILLVFNTILIYQIKKKSTKHNNLVEKTQNNKKASLLKSIDDKFLLAKFNYSKLNEQLKFTKLDGNTISSRDLFIKNNIVFYYSTLNCKNCIDTELNTLLKIDSLSNNPSNKILVISDHNRLRDLVISHRQLQKKGLKNIKFYLRNKKLGIPLEKYNIPFYFYIDSTLTMTNFFVPELEKPKFSEYYLKFGLKNHLGIHKKIKK